MTNYAERILWLHYIAIYPFLLALWVWRERPVLTVLVVVISLFLNSTAAWLIFRVLGLLQSTQRKKFPNKNKIGDAVIAMLFILVLSVQGGVSITVSNEAPLSAASMPVSIFALVLCGCSVFKKLEST